MNIMQLLLYLAIAAAQAAHQHHPPQDANEYAKILNDPERDGWQKPHEVITALNLRKDEVVADIGAGTGYFTLRFARHAAKALAVDIDARLLEMAKKNAPPNVETILAAPDDPKLAAGSVDTIFFCDVLHHIEDRPAYYAKLKSALKPGGRIVIIDFHKKKLPVGPPPEMKLEGDAVIAEFRAAGFELAQTWTMLPYQYFYEFRLGR
jgi:arsenite methyltransferase